MSRPSKRTTAQTSALQASTASTARSRDPVLQLRDHLRSYVYTLEARRTSDTVDGERLSPIARAGLNGQYSAFSACLADLEDALMGKNVERRPCV